MQLTTQKRLAAKILKVSAKKVVFDNTRLDEIKEAITKQDLRTLVGQGAISLRKTSQQSRGRARLKAIQKSKGRQKGLGTRKGKKTARTPAKRKWISAIRLQREFLKLLKDKQIIDNQTYKSLYMKAKGGFFRSKRHIKIYIDERSLAKK